MVTTGSRWWLVVAVMAVLSGGIIGTPPEKAEAGFVSTGTQFNSSSGSAHVGGSLLVADSTYGSLHVSPSYNQSGFFSGFTFNGYADSDGTFATEGVITPHMRDLASNERHSSLGFEIDRVYAIEDGQFVHYIFKDAFEIDLDIYAGADIYSYGDGKGINTSAGSIEFYQGYFDARLDISGPNGFVLDDVEVDYRENIWEGDGPRPSWLEDYRASANFSGHYDAGVGIGVTRVVVPEPATLGLLSVGAIAFALRRRKS